MPGSGDTRGFRLNTHVDVATEFVTRLTASATAGVSLELVINGDIVDFLAERSSSGPVWVPFTPDPDDACQKLEAIVTRDQPFFDALGQFLAAGHRLTLLLGNHDIELGLPPVRAKFASLLGVGGHTDYEFIANDEAYVIGGALIEHGNRYDGFNMVDYDSLRRVSALMSRRQEANNHYTFDAPPGSKMVAWVINPIKEQYRFIDLLKPENGAVVPLLLALEPGARDLLGKVAVLGVEADRDAKTLPPLPAGARRRRWRAARCCRASCTRASARARLAICTRSNTTCRGSTRKSPARTRPRASISIAIAAWRACSPRTRTATCKRGCPRCSKPCARCRATRRSIDPSRPARSTSTPRGRSRARAGFRSSRMATRTWRRKCRSTTAPCISTRARGSTSCSFRPAIISGPSDVAQQQLQSFVEAVGTGGLTPFVMFQPTYLRLDLDAAGQLVNADLYDYSETGSL